MLASMGLTLSGAALASAGLVSASDSGVTDSVYGLSGRRRLPDLRRIDFVVATDLSELKTNSDPDPGYIYFVRDSGRHYRYDPVDLTSVDDGDRILVGADGKRFKRIVGARAAGALSVGEFPVSGSAQSTTGSLTAGSNQLTVASPIDFETGQGILIAGAGAPKREVLTLVLEEEAAAAGTITVELPGEPAQSVTVAAVKETVEITVTSGCSQSGTIALVLDSVQFLIPVEAGESAVQIADRIRGWYMEDWTNGGASGSATVILQAIEPGKKRDSFYFGQGTGVQASATMTKGTRTGVKEIVAAFKQKTYVNWQTGGYPNSNVLFYIAKTNGAQNGQLASVSFGSTGIAGRIEPVQFGSYLLAKIEAISGNVITLSHPAVSAASGVYVGHDDSAALQAALNAAIGETLHIPAGTYRLAAGLTAQKGTSLLGEGAVSTILQYQAVGLKGISIGNGADDVYVGHLQFKNVCSPNTYFGGDSEVDGIVIANAKRSIIEYCRFDNCDDAGIRVGYSSTGNSAGTKVMYNYVANTAEGSGIEVIRGEDCLIVGNIVKYSSQHGVRLCGARKPVAIGNILDHNYDGFSIQGFGNGVNVTQRTQDFLVEGNVVKNDIAFSIAIFNQANSGIIKGNILEGMKAPTGIDLKTVLISGRKSSNFDITIEGNVLKGYNRAIQMRGDYSGIVIRGNTIKDYSASGTGSAYGIYLDCDDVGDIRHIVIEGNSFICTAQNKLGVRFFRPSQGSSVHVHNNSFLLRMSDPARVAEYSVKNGGTASYNLDALVSVKKGTCLATLPDGTQITGTTIVDSNTYEPIPV
ncbi:right-handed parallel beta-helix repeat-containing protein [Paenibacillus oceani]|uniref:Right-handed parallel beta-helix repeat-containing protein n=1 Tax=Paenibacillus oceani TaxID=2772510 RepID=A0A927GYP1_9BACL|nr:right-handed parallel beta-helix repeat-containing protein [Paenibacillus oceani]MBD2861393.1 right-handed parallel beta-helix repeat-containing protein [Paenibacillus oceani]